MSTEPAAKTTTTSEATNNNTTSNNTESNNNNNNNSNNNNNNNNSNTEKSNSSGDNKKKRQPRPPKVPRPPNVIPEGKQLISRKDTGRTKQRVALLFGYIGTGYYGLQWDDKGEFPSMNILSSLSLPYPFNSWSIKQQSWVLRLSLR